MDKCVGKMSVSSPDSGCMVLGCVLADGASRQPPLGYGPPLHGQGHRTDSQRNYTKGSPVEKGWRQKVAALANPS